MSLSRRQRRKHREANRARRARNAAADAITPEQYEAMVRERMEIEKAERDAFDQMLGIKHVAPPDACSECSGRGCIGFFTDKCRRCVGTGRADNEHCMKCGERGPQHTMPATTDNGVQIEVYCCGY